MRLFLRVGFDFSLPIWARQWPDPSLSAKSAFALRISAHFAMRKGTTHAFAYSIASFASSSACSFPSKPVCPRNQLEAMEAPIDSNSQILLIISASKPPLAPGFSKLLSAL